MLLAKPGLAPWRPDGGIVPTVSDAEVLAMAVMSALLGFRSERRWLRYARAHLGCLFPRQIGQSGYTDLAGGIGRPVLASLMPNRPCV